MNLNDTLKTASLNAQMQITCPKCGKDMECLGNVDGQIITSYPPCWYETYVCHKCKCKNKIIRSGVLPPDYDSVKNYEEV